MPSKTPEQDRTIQDSENDTKSSQLTVEASAENDLEDLLSATGYLPDGEKKAQNVALHLSERLLTKYPADKITAVLQIIKRYNSESVAMALAAAINQNVLSGEQLLLALELIRDKGSEYSAQRLLFAIAYKIVNPEHFAAISDVIRTIGSDETKAVLDSIPGNQQGDSVAIKVPENNLV